MTRLFAGTKFDIPPTCDDCGNPEPDCKCTATEKAAAEASRKRAAARLPAGEQTASITVEKRKGNRSVTVVSGLTAVANDLQEILTKLQTDCGTGGTVKAKSDTLELQGDHVDAARQTLKLLGYKIQKK